MTGMSRYTVGRRFTTFIEPRHPLLELGDIFSAKPVDNILLCHFSTMVSFVICSKQYVTCQTQLDLIGKSFSRMSCDAALPPGGRLNNTKSHDISDSQPVRCRKLSNYTYLVRKLFI